MPLPQVGGAETRGSVHSLDDAHVALRGIAQRGERRLVAWAVMRGDRLGDAGELDQHGPLVDGVSGQPSVSVDGLDFDRYVEPLRRLGTLLGGN